MFFCANLELNNGFFTENLTIFCTFFVIFSCEKLFRDTDALMFHATKSGHENFSESTEVPTFLCLNIPDLQEIKPLTEEERKQKTEELREKIKASQAKKAEIERQEALEKERRRREDGKKMLETREKQKDNEMRYKNPPNF